MSAMPWKNPPPAIAPIESASKAVLKHTTQAALAALAPPPTNFASLIDELGAIKAIISKAEKREKVLLELIKPLGDGEHNGTKCICKITTADRATFDKKGLEAAHPEIVVAYTTDKPVTTVTIKALV